MKWKIFTFEAKGVLLIKKQLSHKKSNSTEFYESILRNPEYLIAEKNFE